MNIRKTIILLGSLFFSCRDNVPIQSFERPVRVYEVNQLNYIDKSFSAVVESAEETILAFQTGGELIKLTVEAGDKVQKRELIAQIDPVDYQLQVDATKALYVTSQTEMERYKRLLEKNAVSKQLYESAYANYMSRKSAYENALETLKNTKIYAPFSGIVEQKYVDNFQRVQPTEPIVKIINPDTLEMSFAIAPSDALILQAPKIEYFVRFEYYPDELFKAKLKRFVDASIGGEGFPMIVSIDDPRFSLKKYDIKAGYSCSVIIRVNTKNEVKYNYIPISAIYEPVDAANKKYVWIYDATTKSVKLQKIVTGELFGSDMISVKSGLENGDIIVTAGIYQLTNGQKVELANNNQ